jgi:hypothetical protein
LIREIRRAVPDDSVRYLSQSIGLRYARRKRAGQSGLN